MDNMITQRQLRNQSGEIMRALDRGQSFIVTRNGVPVGELSPIKQRQFVTRDRIGEIFAEAPEVNQETFRADLDRLVDQSPSPRA